MTNRTKAVFWIIFVFLSGSFVGGVLTHVLIRPAHFHAGGGPDRRHSAREPGQPRRNGSRFFKHLDRTLDLDSDQEVQVRRILEATRKSFREAAEEAGKMHREIRSRAGNQIRALLRPEQAEKFDEMTRRMEKRFREGKRRRAGPVQ